MMSPFGKLTLFSVAASAAAVALGSDEGQPVAGNGRPRAQHVSMVQVRAVEEAARPAGEAVEFERLFERKRRADGKKEIGNAFNATSWYVPPPPPPALPPPAPTAPPLPFTYMGQYHDGGAKGMVIFLSSAERVYTVSTGDVIDGTYSVGPITAGQLELTYLPLNIKQSLITGGAR